MPIDASRLVHDGKSILAAVVPKTVFNPYKGSATAKIIELMLTGAIETAGKRFIDLACGSGVVGLAAITLEASSVLFVDINPAVAVLKENRLLRSGDRVEVQDGLEREKTENPESHDLVVTVVPLMLADSAADPTSWEAGVKRPPDLASRFIEQASSVLVPGGKLLVYCSIPSDRGDGPYDEFVAQLGVHFDPDSYRIHAHQHVRTMGGHHIVFEASTKSTRRESRTPSRSS